MRNRLIILGAPYHKVWPANFLIPLNEFLFDNLSKLEFRIQMEKREVKRVVRSQKTEDRSQKTEVGSLKLEVRRTIIRSIASITPTGRHPAPNTHIVPRTSNIVHRKTTGVRQSACRSKKLNLLKFPGIGLDKIFRQPSKEFCS